jgi:hypothetical protein
VCFTVHIDDPILISFQYSVAQFDQFLSLFKIEGSVFMDYNELDNLPTINGVEVKGDLTLNDIGILEMSPAEVNEIVLETFGYILS